MSSKAKMLKAGLAGGGHAKAAPLATLPKPSEAEAMAFVEGKRRPKGEGRGQGRLPNVQPSSRSDVQGRKDVVERSGGRVLRRMTVYLPLDLADGLEKHCFTARAQLSDEVAKAVTAYLSKKPA